jgi:hypothetical protein
MAGRDDQAMAIELARDGVRANALCPGTMDTELMRDCATDSGDPEAYYAAFNRYHPVGRLASPDEIAAFVLCLLSPAAGVHNRIRGRDRWRQHRGTVVAMEFAGKTILITGSTRGIGAAARGTVPGARRVGDPARPKRGWGRRGRLLDSRPNIPIACAEWQPIWPIARTAVRWRKRSARSTSW